MTTVKRLDPADVERMKRNYDRANEITVKQGKAAQHERAYKAKPGTALWIMLSPIRAKEAGKRLEESIPDTKGFYLITQPSGAQSWAFRYRRPQNQKWAKLTIGSVDLSAELQHGETPEFDTPLNLAAARELAEDCARALRRKTDPDTLKKKQQAVSEELQTMRMDGVLFDTVVVEFMLKYPLGRNQKKARASTIQSAAGHLGLKPDGNGGWTPTGNGVLSHWKGKLFARHDGTPALTKKDAYEIIDGMGDRPISANRTVTALKHFGSWTEDRSYVSVNPFATLKIQYPKKQSFRILSAAEIKALFKVVETAKPHEAIGYPYGRIAQLVLVTGQRPGEVRTAEWSEFNFAEREWTIPGYKTKNGQTHVVPLTQIALELLASLPDRGPFLFMAEGSANPVHKQSRVAARLLERVGETVERNYAKEAPATKENPFTGPWVTHSLRHTCFSGMTAAGVPGWLADKVVNHAAPAMQQVYDQHDYAREKAEALAKWEAHLEGLIAVTS
jgi:integrase